LYVRLLDSEEKRIAGYTAVLRKYIPLYNQD